MRPTEELRQEHRVILTMLEAGERKIGQLKTTGGIGRDEINEMLDFFVNFIDRCHHTKEEKHLFKTMIARGGAASKALITVLLREHEEERRRLKVAVESLSRVNRKAGPGPIKALEENISAYFGLIRTHIEKEDNQLYPEAESILSAEEQDGLGQVFRKVELEEVGEAVHEKYDRMAQRFSQG